MVRAALASKRRIGQGPRWGAEYVPAISVVVGSFLAALPIVTTHGWFPDFGLLVLLAWRLLRSDVWPAWWAAPLGLINDLLTGAPVGFSVTLWTAAMLALELIDRRTMWRDYWIEWGLAVLLVFTIESAEWRVAQIMGASLPFSSVLPPLLISAFAFPIVASLVVRLDRWRLGR